MMLSLWRGTLLLTLIALLAGCGGAAEATATPFPFAPDSSEGQGLLLFAGKGRCATCHALAPDTVIVGPSLAGIATRAAEHVEGLTAHDYLEESILNPDAFRPPRL